MITLFVLSILCFVGIVLAGVVMLLVGLPIAIFLSIVPWFLRLAAVVLLVKGLLDRPFSWENLIPAAVALLASGLLEWLF